MSVAGDVTVVMRNEDASTPRTFKAVPAGTILPISVQGVQATLTTATLDAGAGLMAQPDRNYDPRSALYAFAPGLIMTRELEASLVAQYATNGYTPLTESQVLAITGPLPAFPSTIKRLPVV
jgi:hypothetical protein